MQRLKEAPVERWGRNHFGDEIWVFYTRILPVLMALFVCAWLLG